MGKTLLSLLLGGSLALTATSAQAGEVLDRVMKNKVLVEVTDQAYPPFSFLNEENEMDGFDIDLAKEFAKRLGVELKIETPSWEVITAGNWQGRWDICICSMTPTKERAEVLDFVYYYYGTPATILVNEEDDRIKSAADLSGMRVGVQAGTTYEKYLQKELVIDLPGAEPIDFPFEDVTIVPYDSEVTAFADLALGPGRRLDAMVTNYMTAKERIDAEGQFKVVEGILFEEPIWVAIDKGDPEWASKVQEIFAEMKADGTLKAISEKWVGTDITH